MTSVPTSIFRKYDIRGTAGQADAQLTPHVAEQVGKAYGTYVQRQFKLAQVFVGGDNRLSTAALKSAIISGLASTGLHVVDIGEVLTPTVYFAAASHENAGGIMITGSHLETKYNGIKMAYGKLALADQQIQDLLGLIQAQDFEVAEGVIVNEPSMINDHMEAIQKMVTLGPRKLKVVLDAGNGLSGAYVPQVLANLGVEVICLYCEPDGTFPNHLPNPEDPELTKDLEAQVIASGADIGIGFDGDSDRCGLIDNHGHHVAADRLLAMLARDMLKRHPGARVVFDVKASQVLPDEIRKYGGEPIMWKSGHSLVKLKMNEVGALLGGEVSGHIFIGEDYFGFDDAPLVALKVLEILSHSQESIADILDAMPRMLATPEIILPAPDDKKFAIIAAMSAIFAQKGYSIVDVDGARVIFADGWGLVRSSNTQPAITLRFEARTKAQMHQYISEFNDLLAGYPDVDRTKLETQLRAYAE
jgi:phosphomannomutase/phosphoglucomutase